MAELPRVAVGTVQPAVDLQSILLAILSACHRQDIDAQVFCSQSRFDGWGGMRVLPGQRVRHLDSWLMTSQVSQACLLRGGATHDLALVVGEFADRRASAGAGGVLDDLCEDLALPRIVVLDVSYWDPCLPPQLPPETQAILLTGCWDRRELARWQTQVEVRWGIPAWGGIGASLDGSVDLNCEAQRVRVGEERARELFRTMSLESLLRVARSAPQVPDECLAVRGLRTTQPLHVAVAYDEAFHCYFADTMETLEAAGARLSDFSPLRSEALPDKTDVVWLGCGHPENYADRLTRNICLQHSLRAHVYAGGRVYAEGGGLAYACETMECHGKRYPMAGLLPVEACLRSIRSRPIELAPAGNSWLRTRCVKGYLNPNWSLQAPHGVCDYSADSACPLSLVGDRQVIGSRIHLHFASQPQLLQSLLHPVATRGDSGVE